MTPDTYSPYYHVATVDGRPTVFANLEYVQGKPPRTIRVGEETWVLRDKNPGFLTNKNAL